MDSAPNLGPLISRWEINKFDNCWYKSVRILEALKLLFQQFLNLTSSLRDMNGPILGALSNNRWSWGSQEEKARRYLSTNVFSTVMKGKLYFLFHLFLVNKTIDQSKIATHKLYSNPLIVGKTCKRLKYWREKLSIIVVVHLDKPLSPVMEEVGKRFVSIGLESNLVVLSPDDHADKGHEDVQRSVELQQVPERRYASQNIDSRDEKHEKKSLSKCTSAQRLVRHLIKRRQLTSWDYNN